MVKSKDEIQEEEVKKQDYIESQTAPKTVTTQPTFYQGQFADEKRYALAMYEQYNKQLEINKSPEGQEQLKKLRDDWKEKAGDLIPKPKPKEK